MSDQLFLIKLGGSVITDKAKPYTAKKTRIRSIARALKTVNSSFILSHGSGSFGHTSAKQYGGMQGYTSTWGVAKVARDAATLNAIVTDIFLDEGLPVVSMRPMAFLEAKEGKLVEAFFRPISLSLQQGIIPIVHGDIIWDGSWKSTIFSGERVISELSVFLRSATKSSIHIIQLTDVDGLLDKAGKVIPEVTEASWQMQKTYITDNGKTDVTGGMVHKIEEALFMAKDGISTTIINGQKPHQIQQAMSGEKIGTKIIAHYYAEH